MTERVVTGMSRRCPNCGKKRPETGGAFCGRLCEMEFFEGKSKEFEVDIAEALFLERERETDG